MSEEIQNTVAPEEEQTEVAPIEGAVTETPAAPAAEATENNE